MADLETKIQCWTPALNCGWRADVQPIMQKSSAGVWVHFSDYAAIRKIAVDAIEQGKSDVAAAHKLAETYCDLWRKEAERNGYPTE